MSDDQGSVQSDGGQDMGVTPADPAAVGATALAEGAPAGGAPALPEWLSALPAEYQADPQLQRYANIEELAKGRIETGKALREGGKMVPGADASPEDYAKWAETIRPGAAADYDIPVPEGEDTAYADAFREKAFELGAHPLLAKGLAEWNNGQVAAMQEAAIASAEAEVNGLKGELGEANFNAKLAAASALLTEMGVDPDIIQGLDVKLGSRPLLEFIFGLSDKFGEPGYGGANASGGDKIIPGVMTADAAQMRRSELLKDKAWVDKATVDGTKEAREYSQLNAIIAKGAKR